MLPDKLQLVQSLGSLKLLICLNKICRALVDCSQKEKLVGRSWSTNPVQYFEVCANSFRNWFLFRLYTLSIPFTPFYILVFSPHCLNNSFDAQKVVNGATIKSWACVNLCEGLDNRVVEAFCLQLVRTSKITGLVI